MKRIRWIKYYLGAFLIAPFIFKGIQVELGPFTADRLCSACHTMSWSAEFLDRTLKEVEATTEPAKAGAYIPGHFKRPSGVKARCIDCHLTDGLVSLSGVGLLVKDTVIEIFNPAKSEEEFEERRARLAEAVRKELLGSNSASCRNCHVEEAIVPTKIQGRNAHEKMKTQGKTCIDCHYNIIHKKVPWPEKEKPAEGLGDLF